MPKHPAHDLARKTCLVTGASAGIGQATAEGLVRLGAQVVLAVRDRGRGEKAQRSIRRRTGREVEVATVDLASRESIRAFAGDFVTRHPRLDVLVNNAAIRPEERRVGPDGIELVWATNVLAYFLVTDLLLPALRAAGAARVVNVASRLAGGLDLTDVQFERRPWSGRDAYAQSKQADRMLTWALARRFEGTPLRAHALSPGAVAGTHLARQGAGGAGFVKGLMTRLRSRTPRQGADTAVWLAASPELGGRNGAFWFDREEIACEFRDESGEEALWARCRDMTTS